MRQTGAADEPDDSVLNNEESGRERRLQNILPYRWAPGQSGNPKGRPKNRSFSDAIARAVGVPLTRAQRRQLKKVNPASYTDDVLDSMTLADFIVIRHLDRILTGPAAPAISALALVIDRLEGKSVQPLSGPDGAPLGVDQGYVLVVVNDGEEDPLKKE